MKNLPLLFLFLVLASVNGYSQAKEIKIVNGPFLKSIEWYITKIKLSYDSIGKPIKDDELGVVRVDFYNHHDKHDYAEVLKSMDTAKEKHPVAKSDYINCEYFLSMDGVSLLNYQLPTYYFFHNGIRVIIFTGVEQLMVLTEKDIKNVNALKKKMRTRKEFSPRLNEYIPEYLITIDEVKNKEFSAKRFGNLGPPK